jgi:serine/threonine-protein kinase RsbW
MNNADLIKLSLPANAAYVAAARLTASSIAKRMDFDIDAIEDIKAAVSEAFTYVIKEYTLKEGELIEIAFALSPDVLDVTLVTPGKLVAQPKDEMSFIMIRALMDSFNVAKDSEDGADCIKITMHKKRVSGFGWD